jgi:DNA-binding Lrp family transcriptional regulator
MEREKIIMSQRKLKRFQVMGLVEAGKITLKEGAERLGRSYRPTKRILKRVQEKGIKRLIHGNTGKPSTIG